MKEGDTYIVLNEEDGLISRRIRLSFEASWARVRNDVMGDFFLDIDWTAEGPNGSDELRIKLSEGDGMLDKLINALLDIKAKRAEYYAEVRAELEAKEKTDG